MKKRLTLDIFFYFIFFFNSVIRLFQDYISSYETGAKTGELREKTLASRTWLVSHVASAGLEPAPDTEVR